MVTRQLFPTIQKQLFRGKTILLLDPRQVGKTTLVDQLLEGHEEPILLLNDDADDRKLLSDTTNIVQIH